MALIIIVLLSFSVKEPGSIPPSETSIEFPTDFRLNEPRRYVSNHRGRTQD
jgi:hypothetical protein